jgi:acetyltransferase-like isoleucine patch superfamily enzyme
MIYRLKKYLRKHNFIYEFIKQTITRYQKVRYGLRGVHFTSRLTFPSIISNDFELGAYSFINTNVFIGAKVTCGNYVMLGPNVSIVGDDHRIDMVNMPMWFSGRGDLKPTNVGSDVWIGAGCCIKAGICIGDGSIIAMGSIVVKDVPPYSIYGGNPAKLIRKRFSSLEDELSHSKMLNMKPKRLGSYCEL